MNSRRNYRSKQNPGLELKLNLSPPREIMRPVPGQLMVIRSPETPSPSSCLSSSEEEEDGASSPDQEATSSMVVVGCPRCLMYVMLSESEPKCPKCKSSVLLHVLGNNDNNSSNNKKKTRK